MKRKSNNNGRHIVKQRDRAAKRDAMQKAEKRARRSGAERWTV